MLLVREADGTERVLIDPNALYNGVIPAAPPSGSSGGTLLQTTFAGARLTQ